MLEKEAIKTLRLIPELDMDRATSLKFTNSDKLAVEVNMGTDPRTLDVAYIASKIGTDPAVSTAPEVVR